MSVSTSDNGIVVGMHDLMMSTEIYIYLCKENAYLVPLIVYSHSAYQNKYLCYRSIATDPMPNGGGELAQLVRVWGM